MAQATLVSRRRVLAVKVEGTPGTVASPTASDAVFNALDFSATPIYAPVQIDRQGSFGRRKARQGPIGARYNFRTLLRGGSSAPQEISVLMPACGWVDTTGTLSPVSAPPGVSGVTTVTIREDIASAASQGVKTLLRGCAGKWRMEFVSGQPVSIYWEFTGIWPTSAFATNVSDLGGAIMAPSYPTTSALRFASSTLTLAGSYVPRLSRMTIDCGNNVILREDSTDGSGYAYAMITDRVPTGSFDPEFDLVANRDWYGIILAETEEAFSCALGASGNGITIAGPKLQYLDMPRGSRNGIEIVNAQFQFNESSGDDSLTIAYQ